jgi:hypothetical protein
MSASYGLTENHIRYAMENSNSCHQAAIWLRVSHDCFKKNARKYIDSETGLNLYELHKTRTAANRARKQYYSGQKVAFIRTRNLSSIINSSYSLSKKAQLIVRYGFLPECCDNCGYNKKRDYDYTSPLTLWYNDHDPANKSPENIRLLCYNCFYIISYTTNSKYVTG